MNASDVKTVGTYQKGHDLSYIVLKFGDILSSHYGDMAQNVFTIVGVTVGQGHGSRSQIFLSELLTDQQNIHVKFRENRAGSFSESVCQKFGGKKIVNS